MHDNYTLLIFICGIASWLSIVDVWSSYPCLLAACRDNCSRLVLSLYIRGNAVRHDCLSFTGRKERPNTRSLWYIIHHSWHVSELNMLSSINAILNYINHVRCYDSYSRLVLSLYFPSNLYSMIVCLLQDAKKDHIHNAHLQLVCFPSYVSSWSYTYLSKGSANYESPCICMAVVYSLSEAVLYSFSLKHRFRYGRRLVAQKSIGYIMTDFL